MKAHVITLFPEMFSPLQHSIPKRAADKDLFELDLIQLRDYSLNLYGQVDDYAYGGEAGLVMRPEPIQKAFEDKLANLKPGTPVIYTTPQGKVFNQAMARDFAQFPEMVILCGHYKGIDERVIEEYVSHEVSIGDYVLSGGELAAMVMLDSIIRLIPGVINSFESAENDSHYQGLLSWPVYTRPETWKDKRVPEVLTSGHHAKIEQWRKDQSLLRTQQRRPDLLQ